MLLLFSFHFHHRLELESFFIHISTTIKTSSSFMSNTDNSGKPPSSINHHHCQWIMSNNRFELETLLFFTWAPSHNSAILAVVSVQAIPFSRFPDLFSSFITASNSLPAILRTLCHGHYEWLLLSTTINHVDSTPCFPYKLLLPSRHQHHCLSRIWVLLHHPRL